MRSSRTPASLITAFGVAFLASAAYAEDVRIVTREQWGARPPALHMAPNQPVRITLHHTASPARKGRDLQAKLKSLQNFSQTKSKLSDGRTKIAWPDIPYHYYIDVDGNIGEGRQVQFVGDTNTDFDPAGHIGIVLEGNFDTQSASPAQFDATVKLLRMLLAKHHIPIENISTHNAYARTRCPGERFLAMLPNVLDRVQRGMVDAPQPADSITPATAGDGR